MDFGFKFKKFRILNSKSLFILVPSGQIGGKGDQGEKGGPGIPGEQGPQGRKGLKGTEGFKVVDTWSGLVNPAFSKKELSHFNYE